MLYSPNGFGSSERTRIKLGSKCQSCHGTNEGLDFGRNGVKVEGQGPWHNVRATINNLLRLGIPFNELC